MTTATKSKAKKAEAQAKEAVKAANAEAPPEARVLSKSEQKAKAAEKRKQKNSNPDNWVWVPELESKVVIRGLTAKEHEDTIDFATSGGEHEYNQLLQSIAVILTGCVDPVYTEEDVEWLSECDPQTIHILSGGISILTGLAGGDLADLQRRFP